MLFRYVMEHSAIRPLETDPEAFDAVGMRHAANVLGDQVVDGRIPAGPRGRGRRSCTIPPRARHGRGRNSASSLSIVPIIPQFCERTSAVPGDPRVRLRAAIRR